MANVLVNDASLADIADAIREKNRTEETYKPAEMGDAVRAIQSGGNGDFVGIKYSDFDSYRGSPRVADARSLPEENYLFGGYSFLFANGGVNPNNGWHSLLETIYMPKVVFFATSIFYSCGNLKNIIGDFSAVTTISASAFYNCKSLTDAPYMPNLNEIANNGFFCCTGLTNFKFYKNPVNTISTSAFNSCTNITDIYVPWSEGEVKNAPWGATNATIHYNTVYDENHEPIV